MSAGAAMRIECVQRCVLVAGEEEALFQSAHAALTFAFRFAGKSYSRPLMNRLSGKSAASDRGLTGLDGAAQAGLIRAEVRACGRLFEAIITARMAPKALPCECGAACCAGKRANGEWLAAVAFIADEMRRTALKGCATDSLMRRDYVARYFGLGGSVEYLAKRYGIAANTVAAHTRKVVSTLGGDCRKRGGAGLEDAAFEAAEARLREAGIVSAGAGQ